MPAKTIREARAARLEFFDQYGTKLGVKDNDARIFWSGGGYELRVRVRATLDPEVTVPAKVDGLPIRLEA